MGKRKRPDRLVVPWNWRYWRSSSTRAVLLAVHGPLAVFAYRELVDARWGRGKPILSEGDQMIAGHAGIGYQDWLTIKDAVLKALRETRYGADFCNVRAPIPRHVSQASLGAAFRREPIPTAIRRAVLKRDGDACVSCGSPDRLEIDHVRAYARGGRNHMRNLQTLCKPCNLRKGSR